MIQEITSYFDVVFAMPIEAQCHFAIGLSFVGFVFAAFIRETCKQSLVRYGARIIGAASFFAVAAFANHVSHEYEKLNLELMVRKGQHDATSIADPVRVVAVEKEYKAEISDGLRVSACRFSDGRIRSLSITQGRNRFDHDPDRSQSESSSLAGDFVGGSDRRSGIVRAGELGKQF